MHRWMDRQGMGGWVSRGGEWVGGGTEFVSGGQSLPNNTCLPGWSKN